MKKTVQKGISILLALLMLAALFVPVAAEEGYTLTIQNTKSGHTYEAYQIFKGTYYYDEETKTGNLSNIAWGDGIVESKTVGEKDVTLLGALKADETIGDLFADCADAEAVAYVLQENIGDDSEALDAFAEIVNGYLTTTPTATSARSGEDYAISNLSDGYYLVKDKDGTVSADSDAYRGIYYARKMLSRQRLQRSRVCGRGTRVRLLRRQGLCGEYAGLFCGPRPHADRSRYQRPPQKRRGTYHLH